VNCANLSPPLPLDLSLVEARDVPETSHAEFFDQAVREEARRPFDLAMGSLVRARLVEFGDLEHLLLLTVHNLASDSWSNDVLTRDLCACYGAFVQNQPQALTDLRLQFADYADWQHERLAANDFSWQREYWRQQLAGDLPVLDLPIDRPRLTTRDVSNEICARLLPQDLVDAVKAFATREGASPFMVFLTIFEVLLHRYSGQDDFLIATPGTNRQRQDFELLVGPFVNPLLLRADLHDDPTFSELLSRIRRVVLDAFANQEVPFELLLDDFQTSKLQVNFLYQSAFVEPTTLPGGLSVEPLRCVSGGTIYELSASVLEEKTGARLELEYKTALFDRETIERMLGHYGTLLNGAVADPAQPISALPLLTREEKQQLGLEHDSVDASVPRRLDLRTQLRDRVMSKPDAMAVRHGRRELSCAELLARLESAENADRNAHETSDLDQVAVWVAHWRARAETAPPLVTAKPPEVEGSISAVCLALHERLNAGERVASFSPPSAAAMEELGATLLANALLVYPTTELLSAPAAALAVWLEREEIAVACMAAATWNRFAASIGRKLAVPSNLRLVIVTEGDPDEGSFGRVSTHARNSVLGAVSVCSRTVLEAAGGTIAFDGKKSPAALRLRVLDSRSGGPLPIGVPGELAVVDADGNPMRTREFARWLPNGSLDRLGRLDKQPNALRELLNVRHSESAICASPGVRHALVRSFSREDTMLVAYILPNLAAGPLPNGNALRLFLREQGLPSESIPDVIIRLKDVPLRAADGGFDSNGLPPPPEGKPVATSEPVRPYLGLQLQLIAIWEDVLGARGIGIRDNFFDLGGNWLLAMRMLQRAEHACGKMILPTDFFRNPTVEQLASEIAREVIDESPAVLRVNDAGWRTPFFYLHGDLSGGGFYSLKLSRALGPEQAFYVLPPQDVRMLPAAPSIEEMAAAHLQALRAVRPQGPYIIGGFCLSGMVAHELAQQITASGDTVEMLLVIDAAPEDKGLRALRRLSGAFANLFRWDDHEQVEHFGRWALLRAQFALWYKLNVQAQARLVIRQIRKRFVAICGKLQWHVKRLVSVAEPDIEPSRERDMPLAFTWAAAGYRPRPYPGPVAVLLSEDLLHRGDHLARAWQQLAPKVTVHPLRGSHLECITAHVDTLAKTIDSCLRSIAPSPRPSGGQSSVPITATESLQE